ENVGLGRARNAGLSEARGDYVLFLDSDDHYTPGLLTAVAGRLKSAEDPDIVVFAHVRTHCWGRGGPSDASGLLQGPRQGAGAPRGPPRLRPRDARLPPPPLPGGLHPAGRSARHRDAAPGECAVRLVRGTARGPWSAQDRRGGQTAYGGQGIHGGPTGLVHSP